MRLQRRGCRVPSSHHGTMRRHTQVDDQSVSTPRAERLAEGLVTTGTTARMFLAGARTPWRIMVLWIILKGYTT